MAGQFPHPCDVFFFSSLTPKTSKFYLSFAKVCDSFQRPENWKTAPDLESESILSIIGQTHLTTFLLLGKSYHIWLVICQSVERPPGRVTCHKTNTLLRQKVKQLLKSDLENVLKERWQQAWGRLGRKILGLEFSSGARHYWYFHLVAFQIVFSAQTHLGPRLSPWCRPFLVFFQVCTQNSVRGLVYRRLIVR